MRMNENSYNYTYIENVYNNNYILYKYLSLEI